MIPVLTVDQMRALDAHAVGADATVGFGLMHEAALGVVQCVVERHPDPHTTAIAVICGKGNNGGDGYAAAAYLIDKGYDVGVLALCDRDRLRGEARIAYNAFAQRKGAPQLVESVNDLPDLGDFSLIIDAILGSGIRGNPHGRAAAVIEAINACPTPVLAVDTPSGLDNNSGRPGHPCISAIVTVAMGFPKIGTLFYPARETIGRLIIRALSYPPDIIARHQSDLFLPGRSDLRRLLPPRHHTGSKFAHGLALMVCGSRGMYGSATLACQAALRVGCGMVHAPIPREALTVMATKVTEPVLHPLPSTEQGSLAETAFDTIAELSARMQCAAIGPGLSRHEQTSALVRRLVGSLTIPMVLDADGLNAFRGRTEELHHHRAPLLLTPHEGEWGRLFGELPAEPLARIERLRDVATTHELVVLLKGAPTLVATPTGTVYILPVGNSGMATAGSGDVLSGVIAGLVAQGLSPHEGAVLGGCVHGLAGDAAARHLGQHALLASDILAALHEPLVALGSTPNGNSLLAD